MNSRFMSLLNKTPLMAKKEQKEDVVDSDSPAKAPAKTWYQNVLSQLSPQRQALISYLMDAANKVGKVEPLQLGMNWIYLCKETDPVKLAKFLPQMDETKTDLNVPVASLSWEYSHCARLSVASYLDTEAQFLEFFGGEYSVNDMVLFRPEAKAAMPAHMILLHRKRRTIFLVVRGTSSFEDVFADLAGLDCPFSNGRAHAGVSACVDLLLSQLHINTAGKHARVRYTTARSTVEEPDFGSWKYVCPGTVLSGADANTTPPGTTPLEGIALILQRLITASCAGLLDLSGEQSLPREGYKGFRVVVTGHSLGGAVSALLACRLRLLLRFPGITCAEDEDPLPALPYAFTPAALPPSAMGQPAVAETTVSQAPASSTGAAAMPVTTTVATTPVTASTVTISTTVSTSGPVTVTTAVDTATTPDTTEQTPPEPPSNPSFEGHHLPPPVPLFSIGFGTPPPCCPRLSAISALTLLDLELLSALGAVSGVSEASDAFWQSWNPRQFLVGPSYALAGDCLQVSKKKEKEIERENTATTEAEGETGPIYTALPPAPSFEWCPIDWTHNRWDHALALCTTFVHAFDPIPRISLASLRHLSDRLCNDGVSASAKAWYAASAKFLATTVLSQKLTQTANKWKGMIQTFGEKKKPVLFTSTSTNSTFTMVTDSSVTVPSTSTSQTAVVFTDSNDTTASFDPSAPSVLLLANSDLYTPDDTPSSEAACLLSESQTDPSSSPTDPSALATTAVTSIVAQKPPQVVSVAHPELSARLIAASSSTAHSITTTTATTPPHSTRRVIAANSALDRYLQAWVRALCHPDRTLVPPGRVLYVAKHPQKIEQAAQQEDSSGVVAPEDVSVSVPPAQESTADSLKRGVEESKSAVPTVEVVATTTTMTTTEGATSTPTNPDADIPADTTTEPTQEPVVVPPAVAELLAHREQPPGDATSSYYCQFIPHAALWNIPVRGSVTTDHDKELYQFAAQFMCNLSAAT